MCLISCLIANDLQMAYQFSFTKHPLTRKHALFVRGIPQAAEITHQEKTRFEKLLEDIRAAIEVSRVDLRRRRWHLFGVFLLLIGACTIFFAG